VRRFSPEEITMSRYEALRLADPAVFEAIELEVQRQRQNLELIASENYTSLASPTSTPRATRAGATTAAA
jgi:hypothetical protein